MLKMEDGVIENERNTERWRTALANLTETSSNLDSLENLLMKKSVFVDDQSFSRAQVCTQQARTIKEPCSFIRNGDQEALEQRVELLEREVDAAISAAAHARTEKRQAESVQKAAELRVQQLNKELENTSSMAIFFYSLLVYAYRCIRSTGTHNDSTFICISIPQFVQLDSYVSYAEVFGLHMEELRAKQEEIYKRDKEIKLLEAIIKTLGGNPPQFSDG
ncbi:hypothetical protein LIER_21239 [Lithospermum erythrorhizon]|uniref:Uncharacterized protein n=1 Tax=Lithospermum erythrorhizon TaxID=34254 RepID=A0AAV3QPL7_LITER